MDQLATWASTIKKLHCGKFCNYVVKVMKSALKDLNISLMLGKDDWATVRDYDW